MRVLLYLCVCLSVFLQSAHLLHRSYSSYALYPTLNLSPSLSCIRPFISLILISLKNIPCCLKFRDSCPQGIFRVFLRPIFQWIAVWLIALIYLVLMFGWDVPGCGRGQIGPKCNAGQYIDDQFSHTHQFV